MKLGIIQSRGLGDIVIAIPIAGYYHKQGWEIHWPICREFISNFEHHVPWINWHPVDTDARGSFFLEQPRQILDKIKVNEELTLYQALTGEQFHETNYFQHTKFDQYKYQRAGVPFTEKWRLMEYITRNQDRENALYSDICQRAGEHYTLIHTKGSDHEAAFDLNILNPEWPAVEITDITLSIFDWITSIDRAECVIMTDSVMSNMTDQLNLNTEQGRYLIPRSHIGLTPVLGQYWNWIDNLRLDPRHKTIRV